MDTLWQKIRNSLRDVLLIVAGILIAFLLDAWWDGRIERAQLREALAAVQADFMATDAELQAVLESNLNYIEDVSRLIALPAEKLAVLSPQESERLSQLLPRGGLTFDPVLGSVDALISSGQLHRIRNIELRSAIAAWPARLDEISEDHEILIDTYMWLQERSIELGLYQRLFLRETSQRTAETDSQILSLVIADAEMLNRLAAHRFATLELNNELGTVEQQLDKILSLLEQEFSED